MSTVSLHALLLQAHEIIIDGYEIDVIADGHEGTLRLECDEDNTWNIPNQQVALDGLGCCEAHDENRGPISIELRMHRPMTHADLEDT